MLDQVTAREAEATSTNEVPRSHPVAKLSGLWAVVGRDEVVEPDERDKVGGLLPEEFAARAGVSPEVVRGIENGTLPAWSIDGPEVFQVAAAMRPENEAMFWTAANCDLLLSNVLSGDAASAEATAAEVLRDPERREAARSLLTMAVQAGTAEAPQPWGSWTQKEPLLSAGDRAELRAKATELAESGTPNAWVGKEILEAYTAPVEPWLYAEREAEQEAEIEL